MAIFGFYVNFLGCTSYWLPKTSKWTSVASPSSTMHLALGGISWEAMNLGPKKSAKTINNTCGISPPLPPQKEGRKSLYFLLKGSVFSLLQMNFLKLDFLFFSLELINILEGTNSYPTMVLTHPTYFPNALFEVTLPEGFPLSKRTPTCPCSYLRHPQTPKWKEFLHKLLVEGLGYVPGVCWKILGL